MYKLKRKTIEQEIPITINSDECKLNFEKVHGKTEQDGIPTPDNPIDIENVRGKNEIKLIERENVLWNGITINTNDASSYKFNGTATGNNSNVLVENILLTPGTYTLSEENLKYNNNANRIVITNIATSETVAWTRYATNVTFTITENINAKIQMVVLSGSIYNDTIFKIQLERRNNVSSYLPYNTIEIIIENEDKTQKKTSPFTFEEGQYLAEGGYLADDGIHNVLKKIDLSTLNWQKRNTNENNITTYSALLSDRKYTNNISLLCTHYPSFGVVYGVSAMYSKGIGIAYFWNSEYVQKYIYINSNISELEDFITSLTDNILQYELAEESITTYTETQQTQWEAIKSLKSYNGVTHVSIDATLNSKVKFTYNPQLTEEIKTAVSKNSEKAYIEVLDDGTILNESNYLQSVSLSDERYLDKQGIFGTVIAKELTGKFINVDSSFNIENKEIKYYNGPIMSDNSVNYFDYGTYIVQKPENDNVKDNTSFTALDYMVKFNKKFEDRLDYDDPENPVTIGILLQDICDQCEVKLATKTFRNSNYVLENNQFVGGETCREVLSAIAQIAFSWARINEDDELALDFNITNEITEELTPDDYFSLEFNNKYGPINTIVLSNSQIEGENYTIHSDDFDPETDEEITLEIQDNPFAYTEQKRSELIQAGNAILGFEYIPMKIKTAGKNYLNCLDKIKIKNMQDEYYETYIFNNKLDFKGITLDEKETPAMTEAQVKYEYKGEVSQAIKRTEIIVDKQNGTIESITQNVQNLETSEHNDYQEIIQKFDGYAPKSQVVTIENSVTQLQTDTYTKTEINTKLTDGSVTKVQTISGTFDENGMTYEKTNAETKSTINETGINVKKASDDETILFAGYVDENNSQYADYKGQTIVATENILVKKYLVVGSHTRFEDYETGTGCFYLK